MAIKDLVAQSEKIQNRLGKMADEFPWENGKAYVSWLAQSYEYAKFSTRILALTAGRFPLHQSRYSNRFIQHAAEEKGHDRLLASDAKNLGFDISEVPVLAEAEAFHKSLYYWIYQGQPCAILGWILCLECFAILSGPRIYQRVERKFGKRAAGFLYVHSKEDIDHVDKAFGALENCSEDELSQVSHGLELYACLYENMYKAIILNALDQGGLLKAA